MQAQPSRQKQNSLTPSRSHLRLDTDLAGFAFGGLRHFGHQNAIKPPSALIHSIQDTHQTNIPHCILIYRNRKESRKKPLKIQLSNCVTGSNTLCPKHHIQILPFPKKALGIVPNFLVYAGGGVFFERICEFANVTVSTSFPKLRRPLVFATDFYNSSKISSTTFERT